MDERRVSLVCRAWPKSDIGTTQQNKQSTHKTQTHNTHRLMTCKSMHTQIQDTRYILLIHNT